MEDPILVTPEESAAFLRTSRTRVYGLMKTGELTPVKVGRTTRLSFAQVRAWAEAQVAKSTANVA